MENITELLSKISLPAVIYVINFIFIFAVLFLERKTSSARLAWIMVLAFMPIVGFVFYLVFNQNLSRIHINHLYDDEWNAVQTLLKNQMNREDDDDYSDMTNPSAIRRRAMVKLNQVYGESIYTEGNDVDLIVDGNDLMDSMIADIRAAEKNVYAEFFIIKNDRIGKRFIREYSGFQKHRKTRLKRFPGGRRAGGIFLPAKAFQVRH